MLKVINGMNPIYTRCALTKWSEGVYLMKKFHTYCIHAMLQYIKDILEATEQQPKFYNQVISSSPSFGNLYILVAVDYVSKWVEAITLPTNDAKAVVKFIYKNIFSRFETPKAIVSNEGTHFCNKIFATTLAKYGINTKSLQYFIHNPMVKQKYLIER